MDNEEFLRRLSEVSEWHRPQIGPSGCAAGRKGYPAPEHPGVITEAELAELSDEEAEVYYQKLVRWREAQPNPTIRPEIKRLRYEPKPCEDCGEICAKPRIVDRSIYNTVKPHWRERCRLCGHFRNPVTGEFDIPTGKAAVTFAAILTPKDPQRQSKYNRPHVQRERSTPRQQILKLLQQQAGPRTPGASTEQDK